MPPARVQCDSLATLERELQTIREKLTVPETEETWDSIAKAISRFTAVLQNGGANYPTDLVSGLRSIARPISSAMTSERSRLSGVAIDLLNAAAEALGRAFDSLIPLLLPTLLILCARSNRVFLNRAKACILNIVQATQAPSLMSYLVDAAKDKSISLRLTAAETTLACLNSFNPPDLEKEVRGREIEAIIKCTATDANADIRKVGRNIFDAYKILLPQRVDSFTTPLTPTIKKYLDIRSRAPSVSRSNPPSRPTSSQSIHSVQSANAIIRPKSTIPPSATSLHLAKGSTARNPDGQHHARIASSSTAPSLTRSESAPANSRSKPSHAPLAAAVRPLVGPSRAQIVAASSKGPIRDMPPPQSIPIRPHSASHLLPSSVELPSTTTSAPQRPEPVRSTTPSSSNPAGPLRPVAPQGPSRVPQNAPSEKQRVIGGARRVLLPVPDPVPNTSDDTKQKAIGHVRSASSSSTTPHNQPPQTRPKEECESTDTVSPKEQLPSTTDPGKGKAKTKSAPSTSTAPKLIGSKSTNGLTKKVDSTSHTNITTRRGGAGSSKLTEPTQSQLARVKAAAKPQPTNKAESNKPGWGRPAPSKTGATSKAPAGSHKPVVASGTRPKTSEAAAKNSRAPTKTKPKVPPTLVPLPPSPSHSPTPPPDETEEAELAPPAPYPQPEEPHEDVIATDTEDRGLDATDSESEVPGEAEQSDAIVTDPDTMAATTAPQPQTVLTSEPESEDISELKAISGPSTEPDAIPLITFSDPSTPEASFPRIQHVAQTPISALLASIQQGFEMSPAPPFDPDQTGTFGGLVFSKKCEPLFARERGTTRV